MAPTDEDSYPLIDAARARVIRSFRPYGADKENQLALSANDVVYVLEQHSSGWWGGHKEHDDFTGWFPSAYVRLDSEDQVDEVSLCSKHAEALSPQLWEKRPQRKEAVLAELRKARGALRKAQDAIGELEQVNATLEEQVRHLEDERATLWEQVHYLEAEQGHFYMERQLWRDREEEMQKEIWSMQQELRHEEERIQQLETSPISPPKSAKSGRRSLRRHAARRQVSSPPAIRPTGRSTEDDDEPASVAVAAAATIAVAAAADDVMLMATTKLCEHSSSSDQWQWATTSLLERSSCRPHGISSPPNDSAPVCAAPAVPTIAAMSTNQVPNPVFVVNCGGRSSVSGNLAGSGAIPAASGWMAWPSTTQSVLQSAAAGTMPSMVCMGASPPRGAQDCGLCQASAASNLTARDPQSCDMPCGGAPGPVRSLVSAFERRMTEAPSRQPYAPGMLPPAMTWGGRRAGRSDPRSQSASRSSGTSQGRSDPRSQSASRSSGTSQVAGELDNKQSQATSSARGTSVKDKIRQLNLNGVVRGPV